MIQQNTLSLLACPDCNDSLIEAQKPSTLICESCQHTFKIIDGIPDLRSKKRANQPEAYQTKTLANVVAGIYDVAAPLAAASTWRCSPLRFLDATHVAAGRANGGILVVAPIATGIVLDHVLSSYHDLTIIGCDSSWEMLRRAKKRFDQRDDINIQLIHCDLEHLPIKDHVADSVQSLNGLHATLDRLEMLNSFARIAKPNGYLSGSALVRGAEPFADFALTQLEKWGIIPFLRTPEFLVQEMKEASLEKVNFSTFGAVLFWQAQPQESSKT